MRSVKPLLWAIDWLIPLLLLLPLGLALLPGGLVNTADGPVHFVRSAEMMHAWQDGILLPRWAANLGKGYGLPLFVYAPPLPYLLTAFFHMLGLPLELAFKGTGLSALVIGVFGAYALSRHSFGRLAGAVGAAAFLYAPIMLRELFIQGNIAQLLAWMFTPWACWGIIQLFQVRRLRDGVVVALAVMGTLLSHNAAALLLAGTVGSLSLCLWLFTRNGRGLLAAVASSLLGLALSAWFWGPALLEGKYIQLARIVASDFGPRFIPLAELLALSPRLDSSAINPFFPLTLGAVQIGLATLGALCLLFCAVRGRWSTSRPAAPLRLALGVFFVLFTGFCGFMATRWSEPVWRALPFVNLFEWPFRWHGFTAIGLSWLCACAVFAVGWYLPRWANGVGALALCLLLGSALVNLYPDRLPLGTFSATPADIVRFEAKSGQIGTTSLGEFDPIWAVDTLKALPVLADYRKAHPINRLPKPLPANASGTLEFSNVQTQRYRLTLPAPLTLTLNLLYFPGWQATLDADTANPRVLASRPQPTTGLLTVALPAGEHTLTLHFGETPLRQWADWLSLVTWLGLLLCGAFFLWRKLRRRQTPSGQKSAATSRADNEPAVALSLWVAAPVILLLGCYLFLPNWFQLHSPPDQALPASMKLHIDFGDQIRLLGVDPPVKVVAPGETINVVTYWRALQRLSTNYAIFLHLDLPNGQTIATLDQAHPSDIPTNRWAPSLYVRVPLRLTVPATALPIRYRLRVGLVNAQNDAWLAPVGGTDDVLEIGQVWVASTESPRAQAPQARFGDTIQLLGAQFDQATHTLTLRWQTSAALPKDYKIFVHALDAQNALLAQSDAVPYQDQYPTSAWRPQQVIEDQRVLTNMTALDHFAVGLYDPANGERLPAVDATGKVLADKAFVLKLTSLQ